MKVCILIENDTREKLRSIGKKGETYDIIINHLLGSKKELLDGIAGSHHAKS